MPENTVDSFFSGHGVYIVRPVGLLILTTWLLYYLLFSSVIVLLFTSEKN